MNWQRSWLQLAIALLILSAIVVMANPYWSLLLLYNVFLTYVIQTRYEVPDRVAIHFRFDLGADEWISRKWFLILSPIFVATICLIPVAISVAVKLGKDDFMARHVAWLGSLLLGYFFALYVLMVAASRHDPIRLPRSFWGTLIAFLAAVIIWSLLTVTHQHWGWPR